VKIDRLDYCIQTEAGRGLAFRMQTHFASILLTRTNHLPYQL